MEDHMEQITLTEEAIKSSHKSIVRSEKERENRLAAKASKRRLTDSEFMARIRTRQTTADISDKK